MSNFGPGCKLGNLLLSLAFTFVTSREFKKIYVADVRNEKIGDCARARGYPASIFQRRDQERGVEV